MLIQNLAKPQRGLGIIELMVSILLASIVLAGVVALILNISVTSGTNIKSAQLQQALRGSMDYMSRDLARAGYVNWFEVWARYGDFDNCSNPASVTGSLRDLNDDGAINMLDYHQCIAPVLAQFGTVSLAQFDTAGDVSSGMKTPPECSTDCDCILYSYDHNIEWATHSGDFELFGFRWNEGRLQSRSGAPATADHSCVAGDWVDLTEPVIEITDLGFSLVYFDDVGTGKDATVFPITGGVAGGPSTTCTPGAGGLSDDKCLWRRKVDITLSGHLAADNEVQMDLNGEVKIRNDFFQTESP
ncbi:prepilin-type N-terminal cleavage/methylation domain-containing protein [Parahaliea sp. F7430]|uniref:Prepilin-type N-terminal cleavage/methylation domain-containing protein n=1 Tax=Sediminihaliea albiluteola TaxID=2758564 RepID=A0A7W2TTS5_9GAMM|nr:prepilin-type N-terminal cleavage/methylation domain-containing protein [Sediminihaliea albiluteola]MBA6411810.1 prepilin-type N-terminal cleavage/methylation domain-containing protein [Sediminihaliea albiluteola]